MRPRPPTRRDTLACDKCQVNSIDQRGDIARTRLPPRRCAGPREITGVAASLQSTRHAFRDCGCRTWRGQSAGAGVRTLDYRGTGPTHVPADPIGLDRWSRPKQPRRGRLPAISLTYSVAQSIGPNQRPPPRLCDPLALRIARPQRRCTRIRCLGRLLNALRGPMAFPDSCVHGIQPSQEQPGHRHGSRDEARRLEEADSHWAEVVPWGP